MPGSEVRPLVGTASTAEGVAAVYLPQVKSLPLSSLITRAVLTVFKPLLMCFQMQTIDDLGYEASLPQPGHRVSKSATTRAR
jgi:hypothetical protein